MTSLSRIIKRQRATADVPQRIESTPLTITFNEPEVIYDHEQALRERYLELERNEQAFQVMQEQAHEALEQVRIETMEAARQAGYTDGFEQGKKEGRAEYDELTTRLNMLSQELEQTFEEKWRSAEQQLVKLAVTVSAHVTTERILQDEALFADLIREQMAHQVDDEALTIYVHPTRLASIQRFESLWVHEESPPLKYRGDTSLAETGVRIESPKRGVEVDLSYSYERIQSKIEEVLANGAY